MRGDNPIPAVEADKACENETSEPGSARRARSHGSTSRYRSPPPSSDRRPGRKLAAWPL